ncbi:TIGR02281 family clan AA aspartic protease [Aquabacter cavernae]|uniref:TIGR02281 family clan AA aspartic protease n=1 Tax=Aquabacter cavernae TaxID=2496029 RepID=UPI000F8C71C0|nr:TIGR02281 family clan AA aspartic protease [Aquabacter cavernae]
MRGDRFLWLLLGFIGVGLAILVIFHGEGEVFGLSLDQFGHMVVSVALISVIGATAWRMFAGKAGDMAKAFAFWAVIAAVLAVAYTYRAPLQEVGQRVLGEMVPGMAVSVDARTVEITRSGSGSFAVNALVNGAPITFMLDTGASVVVLTQDDARAAGIAPDGLRYDVPVDTANGRTRAASVTLRTVAVGSISETNVRALVSAPGALRTSLLGMTFLSRLAGFQIDGDKLILRGPAR